MPHNRTVGEGRKNSPPPRKKYLTRHAACAIIKSERARGRQPEGTGSPTRGGKTSPQDPYRAESCCAVYKCEPSAKNATASLWKRDGRTRQKKIKKMLDKQPNLCYNKDSQEGLSKSPTRLRGSQGFTLKALSQWRFQ